MKKQILSLFIILCLSQYSIAQNNNANSNANAQWKINGNTASTTDFMGTTNNQSLVFKTNNIARAQFDTQGRAIFDGGGEVIIRPGGLNRPILTNPIAAYMLKVGGSGHFDGEVNTRQLFVQEYITYLKTLKGPRIDVDTIRMDSTRGIFGHTKIFGNVDIKQNLIVSGDATFKNTLTAEKGIMFDGVNGLRYTAPTATSSAKYNLGGGIYKPSSTACPTPNQNFVWFATQGAYISHIGANTPGAPPSVDASITMMTAPWDGNGIIEVDGTDKNGGTSNGLLINYFCGRDVGICVGANGGTVSMGKTIIGNPLNSASSHFTDAMLSVNGKIVSKSLFVTALNWADFVFDENYKLPKLSEIEAYYKINKHLPSIPSEKEIMEKGIDLSEMNKLLLQKIEELTILMVEQEKRIKKLESEN